MTVSLDPIHINSQEQTDNLLNTTNQKMSWQQYIDVQLLGTGKVAQAAILGLNDQSTWATSAGFTVTPAEAKSLVAGLADDTALRASGIYAGGVKYFYLSGEKDVVLRGKKGTAGIHVAKTNQAIIIGVYDEKSQPNECANIVEGLAEYLKSQNY